MKLKSILIIVAGVLAMSVTFSNQKKNKKCEATTLIIVRHAEKNNETDTSTLAPNGIDRANRLAQLLVNTNLAAVYATPFIRTRLTVLPAAQQHNLEVIDYTPHQISEIDKMITTHSGKTVLIVGHSNTIPEIVNHYIGSSFPHLTGYNDIFIVNINLARKNKNNLTRLYY